MAYNFDATAGEYLRLSQSVITDEPFSLSIWWWPDNDVDSEFFSISDASQSAVTGLGHRSDGTYKLRFRDHTTYVYGQAMALDTWHHCGTSVSGSGANNVAVYTNGTQDLGSVGSLQRGGDFDRLTVGRADDSSPSNHADGRCAFAAAWNVALTQAEFAILRSYSPLFVRPQSLVYYAPLIRGLEERIGGVDLTKGGSPEIVSHPPIIMQKQIFYSIPVAAGGPAAGIEIFRRRIEGY